MRDHCLGVRHPAHPDPRPTRPTHLDLLNIPNIRENQSLDPRGIGRDDWFKLIPTCSSGGDEDQRVFGDWSSKELSDEP